MKTDQRDRVVYAMNDLRYCVKHPWVTKWTLVERLRWARSQIQLTLKSIAASDNNTKTRRRKKRA